MNTLLNKVKRGNISALRRYTNNTITKTHAPGTIPLAKVRQNIELVNENISRNELEPAIASFINLLENYKQLRALNDTNQLDLKLQINSLCKSLMIYYLIKKECTKNV